MAAGAPAGAWRFAPINSWPGKLSLLGPDPEAAGVDEQSLGWRNPTGKSHGRDPITSGIKGAWTTHPIR